MEEEKKEVSGPKEPMGDADNGKDHLNFCLLCSKHTKDKLQPVQIGAIFLAPGKSMPVMVDVCPGCVVIVNNAARIFRDAVTQFKKDAEEVQKKIIVPGMAIPKGILKTFKKS
jgi:hypothetical protein